MEIGTARVNTLTANTFTRVYSTTIGNGNLILNGNFESWSAGAAADPDGWATSGFTPAREGTTIKIGTYSAKLTKGADPAHGYLTQNTIGSQKGVAYWVGKTLTFGCWVKATNTYPYLVFDILGGTSSSGSAHTGGGDWEWLTVSHTVDVGASRIDAIIINTGNENDICYVDGAVCVEAASLAPTTSLDNFEKTSISITSLTGDTDEIYILRCKFVNGYGAQAYFYARPNNDGGANYGFQYLYGATTTASAARNTAVTGFYLANINAQDKMTYTDLIIYAKSGYVRTGIVRLIDGLTGTTVAGVGLFGESWNNIATEITSLVVTADQTNGLGVNTTIDLYKLVRST